MQTQPRPLNEDVPPDRALYDERYDSPPSNADDTSGTDAHAHTFKVQELDYDNQVQPWFGWMNTKTIKKTFEKTTQYDSQETLQVFVPGS